ncbi:MAG: response regulator transcription factor [Bacteroidales bacterium]|jgi:DNA-binding NarL/FixJ family response regulator|nr:response regulator transcription factor [Bacteroidales bacterium]
MIKVIIVDDHNLFRMGLKAAFRNAYPDISIIGEAEFGKDLFSLAELSSANVVLLDVNMPDIGGADIARRLRLEYPDIKILVISSENGEETVKAMVEAGIDGFISKRKGTPDEIVDAIQNIVSGMEYYGRDIAPIIFGVYVAKKNTAKVTSEFTEREREIILLCKDGLLCKEVASKLNISISTVKTHKERIFQKLGINNTMEMVQYAMKNGIIRIE